MKNKKMATIAATLLLGVTPTIALINQPIHTVQAANKALKGKVVLKKIFQQYNSSFQQQRQRCNNYQNS